MRYIDDQLRNLQQQRESREQEFYEAQRALKSIQEQARKPDVGRTYELIKEALATVNESGIVIAVVLARNLFKSPQVDRIRSQAVEHGRLDLVVELPRGVDGADERVAVLVFRKGRKKTNQSFSWTPQITRRSTGSPARPSASRSLAIAVLVPQSLPPSSSRPFRRSALIDWLFLVSPPLSLTPFLPRSMADRSTSVLASS